VGLLRKQFQILPTVSHNLILQKAFGIVAQMNEELKEGYWIMHFAHNSNF